MKYNLIFKEKRKKIYFFTNLNFLLSVISFFDFADFQLLKVFKIIFMVEKSKNNKFFILVFLKNFFIFKKIRKLKMIQNLNVPTLIQFCYFINKCIPFIKYKFKTPIITLKIFFLIYSQRILNCILFFNSNIYLLLKINLINHIILLKKYFINLTNLFKKDLKIYIYLIVKFSKKFKYFFLNIYELRSFFFRYILHNKFQKYLKEDLIYSYI